MELKQAPLRSFSFAASSSAVRSATLCTLFMVIPLVDVGVNVVGKKDYNPGKQMGRRLLLLILQGGNESRLGV